MDQKPHIKMVMTGGCFTHMNPYFDQPFLHALIWFNRDERMEPRLTMAAQTSRVL